MNLPAWIAGAALVANIAVVSADLRLFLWTIQGLENPKSLFIVTVTPTTLGLAGGLDVTEIAIKPAPTLKDPDPNLIRPVKTEPMSRSGLRASFKPGGRRFHLFVTFRDGTARTIDPWGPMPPSGTFKVITRPALEIAGQPKRG